MNSPVDNNFNFLRIDKNSKTPIYLQLVDEIIKAIQLGYLNNGYQLPGTRQFAKVLGLNRNTVVKSLEELAALGWIDIRPNKGTYIKKQSHKILQQQDLQHTENGRVISGFKINTSYLLDQEKISLETIPQLQINSGVPDQRLIQIKNAYKAYHQIIKRKVAKQKNENSYHPFFVKQFLNYLTISRHIHCSEEHIHFVSSRAMALQLISKLLFQPKDEIIINETNEQIINLIFQSNDVKLRPIAINDNGINLEKLQEMGMCKSVKGIYLPSSHLYPTTQSFPLHQRKDLIDIAERHQLAIVDDESYSSYYYTHRPLLSINAQFPNNQTITVGQFGDGLPSLFHLNYIIGPSDFIAECKKLSCIYEEALDPFLLETACTLIEEGEILRIERKHRKIYRERRERLGNRLRQTFGESIQLQMPLTGLGLWLEWKIPLNLMKLKKDALEKGLVIPQHLLYQTEKISGIRIGFGTLNEDEIDQLVDILKACVDLQ